MIKSNRTAMFKSPIKKYQISNIKHTNKPKSPSPKRKDYVLKAKVKDEGVLRCTYVHPITNKRCRNKLEIYPQYCELHTMMIENVYIDTSNIKFGGNGLFAGPYGFKKGDKIGIYGNSKNEVSLAKVEKRCKEDGKKCWEYILCDHGDKPSTKCWDGKDIRSTLMRNINDAHKSQFKNNSYFEIRNDIVYVIASRNIKPGKEIFVDYGKNYW